MTTRPVHLFKFTGRSALAPTAGDRTRKASGKRNSSKFVEGSPPGARGGTGGSEPVELVGTSPLIATFPLPGPAG